MKRFFLLIAAALILSPAQSRAADLTLFLTSNTEGRFSLSDDDLDPALLILQSLYKKRAEGRPLLYLDLGNSLYPGLLSRYSFGSVAYDYLSFNGCDATVVSSRDIRIGVDSLLRLDAGPNRLLLSSNIMRCDSPVFLPWTIKNVEGKKIAITGISGDNALFDITDTMTSNVMLAPEMKAIESVTAALREKEHPDAIILLSGLSSEKNLRIMNQFPEISLCVCGGDNRGTIHSQPASRVILNDGREILFADSRKGYFLAECSLSDRIAVKSFSFTEPVQRHTANESYLRFCNRLSLWKSRFIREQSAPLTDLGDSTIRITDDVAANLMRDQFRTELSILAPPTVNPFDVSSASTNADILKNLNDDFYIYRFKMKGSDISALTSDPALQMFGFDNGKIRGYPLVSSRKYTVTATQSAYEKIMDAAENYSIPFENTWKTIPDVIAADLAGDHRTAARDFTYLDDRFGFLTRLSLSNSFDRQHVREGDTISAPNDMVGASRTLFCTEDSADFVLYNSRHMFTVSPYVYFMKEELDRERALLANTFKCAFLYQLNTSDALKPYLKSLYQTPIEHVDRLRPLQIRNTAGIDIITDYFKGKTGAGFSKQVNDPERCTQYGLEANGTFIYPFLSVMKYKCAFDAFAAQPIGHPDYYLNFQLTNGVSCSITNLVSVTLFHRYTFYHDGTVNENYRNNTVRLALDMATELSLF